MSRLSVVTPCFNQARYVRETLASVRALSAPHEHIVIDAGSTDGTLDILREAEDPALHWVSEPDRGQTHAVNKGLERAQGEICGWLNADDAYVSDAVDRAMAMFERDSELAAVYGGIEITDDEGRVRRTYIPARWSWRRMLYLGDYIPTPTIFFRRSLLTEVGMLDETWHDAADYDFYLRMFRGRKVARIPEPLVRFRFHSESKTATQVWVQLDEMLAIRQRWARTPLDRFVMVGAERLKRFVLPRISNWPEYFPEDEADDAAVTKMLDRVRRASAERSR